MYWVDKSSLNQQCKNTALVSKLYDTTATVVCPIAKVRPDRPRVANGLYYPRKRTYRAPGSWERLVCAFKRTNQESETKGVCYYHQLTILSLHWGCVFGVCFVCGLASSLFPLPSALAPACPCRWCSSPRMAFSETRERRLKIVSSTTPFAWFATAPTISPSSSESKTQVRRAPTAREQSPPRAQGGRGDRPGRPKFCERFLRGSEPIKRRAGFVVLPAISAPVNNIVLVETLAPTAQLKGVICMQR